MSLILLTTAPVEEQSRYYFFFKQLLFPSRCFTKLISEMSGPTPTGLFLRPTGRFSNFLPGLCDLDLEDEHRFAVVASTFHFLIMD